ncbi:MAG: MG2 domain-containing protein [Candidatus Aminicenantia bacterium]
MKTRILFFSAIIFLLLAVLSNCQKEKESKTYSSQSEKKINQELKILSVSPLGEVRTDDEAKMIIVNFSEIMVPLEALPFGKGSGPLKLDPPNSGKFRWMGTRTLTFVPDKRFSYGTEFKVFLQAGLRSLEGAILRKEYSWTFQTIRPRLIYHYPKNKAKWVQLDQDLLLQFNQSISLKEISKYILFIGINPAGEKYRPSYQLRHPKKEELEEIKISTQLKEVIILEPRPKLRPDYTYYLELLEGLSGTEGQLGMSQSTKFSFQTYRQFEFEGVGKTFKHNPTESLRLFFTNPVIYQELVKKIKFQPEIKIPEYYFQWADYASNQLYLYLPLSPETEYIIILPPDLEDKFGNKLGKEIKVNFSTGSYPPSVRMKTGQGIIEALGDLKYPIFLINTEKIELEAALLEKGEIIPLLLEKRIFWSGEKFIDSKRLFTFRRNIKSEFPKNKKVVYPIELKEILGDNKNFGFIFLQLNAHFLEKWDRFPKAFLQVTDLGLTAKFSPENNLIWVTALQTGRPIPQAKVEIRGDDNRIYWKGKTDEQGMVETPGWKKLGMKGKEKWGKPRQWVFVSKEEDFAFIASDWGTGIYPYRFGIDYDWNPEPEEYKGCIFSDRGIYRPGEEVRLKGIIRKDELGQWRLPEVKEFEIEIKDSRQEEVFKRKVDLNSFGSFSLNFSLSKDASLGNYRITVRLLTKKGEREKRYNIQGSFRVEAFRPAEFEVTVRPEKESYIFGDTYQATISGNYLFGAPMAGQKVNWYLRQDPVTYSPPGYKGYVFGSAEWWGEPRGESALLASGEGLLDKQGRFKIEAKLLGEKAKGSSRVILEGVVAGPSRQTIAGRSSSLVHQGEYYIGLKPETTFCHKGKELAINLIAVSPMGKMVPNRKLTLRIFRREWHSVRKAGVGGRYQWVTQKEDKEIMSFSLVSGLEPLICSFTPKKSGFYILQAEGKDSRRNEVRARTYLYVTGKDYVAWERRNDDIIELIADKKHYRPGEVARILIKSPYEKAKALVTLEREGIIDHRILEIKGTANKIDLPITNEYLPNVFVSVILIQGRTSVSVSSENIDPGKPSFKIGYLNLPVSPEEKHLKVDVSSNKKEYRPGEEVTLNLRVKDSKNKGVISEIVVAVVDSGVLNLIGYQTPDPFYVFYGQRPLAVQTSETRLHIIGQRHYGQKGENVGGGGEESEKVAFGLAGIELRGEMKATAYWNPSLVTDKNGQISVSFKLPDNLTTFKIMVVAQTQDSLFGYTQSSIKVNKPLMLRSTLPAFARVGDVFEAGAIVHNYTLQKGGVILSCQAKGILLLDKGIRRFKLDKGGAQEVRFHFRVEKSGEATISFRAKMGQETDGLKVTLPLRFPRPTESVALFQETTESTSQKIKIPWEIYPDGGEIEIQASPSAFSNLKENLDFLLSYPYGCLEQQLSKILPLIVARDLLTELKLGSLKVKDLDKVVDKTLAEVPQYQKYNGGFALWTDSEYESPYLTCYTMFTLLRAQEARFKVDKKIINRAKSYLLNFLHGKLKKERYPYSLSEWSTIRAFALYVLAELRVFEFGYIEELYKMKDSLPLLAKTFLIKTLNLQGSNKWMKKELLREILNKVKVSPTTAHFEEAQGNEMEWIFHSNTRTTALILQTLLEVEEKHPLIPRIVRWSIEERKIKRWRSTQENFYVFYALSDYFRSYEKEKPNFRLKIFLANQLILEDFFKERTLRATEGKVDLKDFKKGVNLPLKIKKKGPGRLYYSVRMTYLPKSHQEPRDEGLAVFKSIELLKGNRAKSFKPGSLVVVTLRIVTPQERHFVVVDDPLPAGFIAVNPSFMTESQEAERKLREIRRQGFKWRWSRFNHIEMHEDRVLLFADYLPPGIHTHQYLARAITYGSFQTPATKAEEMYTPEVFGRTPEFKIDIK